MNEASNSIFDFMYLVSEEIAEHMGEFTAPVALALITDSLLTFFMIYFLGKWIFDILKSIGKGGRR